MILNDEDSWEMILECLNNAGWSEEEIEDITREQLELVVDAINETLVRTHKKSSMIIIQHLAEMYRARTQLAEAIRAVLDAYDGTPGIAWIPYLYIVAASDAVSKRLEELELSMVAALSSGDELDQDE